MRVAVGSSIVALSLTELKSGAPEARVDPLTHDLYLRYAPDVPTTQK